MHALYVRRAGAPHAPCVRRAGAPHGLHRASGGAALLIAPPPPRVGCAAPVGGGAASSGQRTARTQAGRGIARHVAETAQGTARHVAETTQGTACAVRQTSRGTACHRPRPASQSLTRLTIPNAGTRAPETPGQGWQFVYQRGGWHLGTRAPRTQTRGGHSLPPQGPRHRLSVVGMGGTGQHRGGWLWHSVRLFPRAVLCSVSRETLLQYNATFICIVVLYCSSVLVYNTLMGQHGAGSKPRGEAWQSIKSG